MNNKLIPIAIIIAGILVAGGFIYNNYQKCSTEIGPKETPAGNKVVSSQEAGDKLIKFINDNILKGQAIASLLDVLEESGLYKVKFSVENQEVEWQISKDGKLIFPQVIDLTKIEPEPEPEPVEESFLEGFARCLAEKGMKFYGASGCGWCQKQKELFGEAAQYLPYIECADEETGGLTIECQGAGIQVFPTWQLPNGEKSSGYKSLEELSQLSGCPLE